MDVRSIPEDLTEPQFRKMCISVLEGFEASIKEVSKKVDTLIDGRVSNLEQQMRDTQRDSSTKAEMKKAQDENRKWRVGLLISVIMGAMSLLWSILGKHT